MEGWFACRFYGCGRGKQPWTCGTHIRVTLTFTPTSEGNVQVRFREISRSTNSQCSLQIFFYKLLASSMFRCFLRKVLNLTANFQNISGKRPPDLSYSSFPCGEVFPSFEFRICFVVVEMRFRVPIQKLKCLLFKIFGGPSDSRPPASA